MWLGRFYLQTLCLFVMMWGSAPLEGSLEELLAEAATEYIKGEQATAFNARQQAFNRALYLYHQAAAQIPPSPSLHQALGDTYFQLQEYPWALLYYLRALQADPNQALLMRRASDTAAQLGLSHEAYTPHWTTLISGKSLFWIGWCLFWAVSGAIWWAPSLWRPAAIIATLAYAALAGGGGIAPYFRPVKALLITATPIYSEPDWRPPLTGFDPLPAGSTVSVMEITPDGAGLKIRSSWGQEGFVPTAYLRLL